MNLEARLTKRQDQVLELIATGCQQKEAAEILHISVKTIDNHVQAIKQRISVNNDRELTVFYFCRRFAIPYAVVAIKKGTSVLLLYIILTIQIYYGDSFQARRARTVRSGRRYEYVTDNPESDE